MSSAPVPSTKPEERSDVQRRADHEPTRREDAPAQRGVLGTRPEAPPGEEGDEQGKASRPASAAPSSDRAVDADLLLDIPQLTVEQLTLDLDASLVLNNVKLDAKGLDVGLFLKADLDLLRMFFQKGSAESAAGRASYPQRGSDTARVPSALRELLAATRHAYRDVSDPNVQRSLRNVHTSAREADEHVAASDEQQPGEEDGSGHGTLDRARHAAREGAKAVGLTAAGLAGGALLESRIKPSRRLPVPRRRNRAQTIGHEIGKRLP